jgi:hypothetical protein
VLAPNLAHIDIVSALELYNLATANSKYERGLMLVSPQIIFISMSRYKGYLAFLFGMRPLHVDQVRHIAL